MRRFGIAVASILAGMGAFLTGTLPAFAAGPKYPPGTLPPVTPTHTTPTTVARLTFTSGPPTGQLAFTGADIAAMVIVGLLLIAAGVALVAFARRRLGFAS